MKNMKRGISPVIAVVLMIAIAVVAATGVWYWVAELGAKPAGAQTEQPQFIIEQCEITNDTAADIRVRNTGGTMINHENVSIYEGVTEISQIDFTEAPGGALNPGDITYFTIQYDEEEAPSQGFQSGVEYTIVDGDFPARNFDCS